LRAPDRDSLTMVREKTSKAQSTTSTKAAPERKEKVYKAAIDDLFRKTIVVAADLDGRFFLLLDRLQEKGRAIEGVRQVAEAVENLERERVFNWRAYLYTLLKKFDEGTSEATKTAEDRKKESSPTPQTPGSFNVGAPEFVPGNYWGGRLNGATPHADDSQGLLLPVPLKSFEFTTPPPMAPMYGYFDMGSGPKLPMPQVASPSLSQLLNLEDDIDFSLPPPPAPPPLPMVPPLPGAPLPSPGSAGHAIGECKPCAFLHSKGCANAETCQFCHLCDAEEKKRRRRGKRALPEHRRQMGNSAGPLSFALGLDCSQMGNMPVVA